MGDVYIEIDGKRIKIGSDRQHNDTVEDPQPNDELFGGEVIYEQEEPHILSIFNNKEDIMRACSSDIVYIKASKSYMTCGVYLEFYSLSKINAIITLQSIHTIEESLDKGEAKPDDLFIVNVEKVGDKINLKITFEDINGHIHTIYDRTLAFKVDKSIKMYYRDGVLMLPEEY